MVNNDPNMASSVENTLVKTQEPVEDAHAAVFPSVLFPSVLTTRKLKKPQRSMSHPETVPASKDREGFLCTATASTKPRCGPAANMACRYLPRGTARCVSTCTPIIFARLVFVIILLEITDLMFALDSVSAKIAAVPSLHGIIWPACP